MAPRSCKGSMIHYITKRMIGNVSGEILSHDH